MEETAGLAARWTSLARDLGARRQEASEVYADLDRRYCEAHRRYHDWRHIADCLRELDAARDLCRRPDEVELALWFHDAVCDPRRADNEERSAALLGEAGARLELDAGTRDRAALVVLATAHGAGPLRAPGELGLDLAVALDVDLAILGRAAAEYDAYEAKVRAEYGFLADEDWRRGRAGVLRMFLERPRIYLTDRFRERCEAQARRNLSRSLSALGG